MKTMQPEDIDLELAKFPAIIQPKIDGVRLYNLEKKALGRSMKPVANKFTTALFSADKYNWLDSEATIGPDTSPDDDLCRKTTSALSTVKGEPIIHRYCFDYLSPDIVGLPYIERYNMLRDHLKFLNDPLLHLVPSFIVNSLDEYKQAHAYFVSLGYEGSIYRALDGRYKEGRCTVRMGLVLRLKDFIDGEIHVTSFTEAMENTNEATINERGNSQRSTHKENMIPKGMIGNIIGMAVKDIVDPVTGKICIKKGDIVTIGPGEMTHDERIYYYNNPSDLLNRIAKFKFFPRGMKDKPRFPTFSSFRSPDDMGE